MDNKDLLLRLEKMAIIQEDMAAMLRQLLHRLPVTDPMRVKYTEWLKRVGLSGKILRDTQNKVTAWEPAVKGNLPHKNTPVLLKLANGEIHTAVLLWELPGHEDTFEAYPYWDSPYDPGQEWEWGPDVKWASIPR